MTSVTSTRAETVVKTEAYVLCLTLPVKPQSKQRFGYVSGVRVIQWLTQNPKVSTQSKDQKERKRLKDEKLLEHKDKRDGRLSTRSFIAEIILCQFSTLDIFDIWKTGSGGTGRFLEK